MRVIKFRWRWAPRPLVLTEVDLLVCLLLVLMGMLLSPLGRGSDDSASAQARAWSILGSQVMIGLPPAIWLAFRAVSSGAGLAIVGLHRWRWRDVATAVVAMAVVLPVVQGVMLLSLWLGELAGYAPPQDGHAALRMLREAGNPGAWALVAVSAVIVAPLTEELLYRGLVQSVMLKLVGPARRWRAIIAAAMIFAMVHAGAVPWQAIVGLFVLGVALGVLLETTGRLWPSILLHAMFNAANLMLAALETKP